MTCWTAAVSDSGAEYVASELSSASIQRRSIGSGTAGSLSRLPGWMTSLSLGAEGEVRGLPADLVGRGQYYLRRCCFRQVFRGALCLPDLWIVYCEERCWFLYYAFSGPSESYICQLSPYYRRPCKHPWILSTCIVLRGDWFASQGFRERSWWVTATCAVLCKSGWRDSFCLSFWDALAISRHLDSFLGLYWPLHAFSNTFILIYLSLTLAIRFGVDMFDISHSHSLEY